jgi:hypothetical protein
MLLEAWAALGRREVDEGKEEAARIIYDFCRHPVADSSS